ncbi:HD domain-containing protein [Desulforamulus aeronauticus]|uniref:HDIG domain-containing protein n=1 Tax=Desulforamulus aeronauticus DSM 10349 TaxID=1121421 RepID=A0A1M6URD3_9FIRM|nr:HD domain-containing protein [Desulforamulus aeronauticus]SHK71802.1 HDIG domain-containing protein [Desulforamulus aeronauticus DSM 10349]
MAALQRVKQFWHAIMDTLDPKEIEFVQKSLNKQEQSLFYAMDRPTQTHCVRVAKTCLELSASQKNLNTELLVKAALLHDIGKPANCITTLDKVLIVLLTTFAPKMFQNILHSDKGGRFIDACKNHSNHPVKGAALAERAHLPAQQVLLIRNHHNPPKPDDSPELVLLRKADELN